MKDAVRYKVQIVATVERTEKIGKRWEPMTSANAKTEYGYTPETETVVRREITVLEQTVDTLDVAAVIKAVNGIA